MHLFISTQNNNIKISNIHEFFIHGWSEYKMTFDLIKVQKLETINTQNTN